jgi:hypothetical protein
MGLTHAIFSSPRANSCPDLLEVIVLMADAAPIVRKALGDRVESVQY